MYNLLPCLLSLHRLFMDRQKSKNREPAHTTTPVVGIKGETGAKAAKHAMMKTLWEKQLPLNAGLAPPALITFQNSSNSKIN